MGAVSDLIQRGEQERAEESQSQSLELFGSQVEEIPDTLPLEFEDENQGIMTSAPEPNLEAAASSSGAVEPADSPQVNHDKVEKSKAYHKKKANQKKKNSKK